MTAGGANKQEMALGYLPFCNDKYLLLRNR